MCQLQNFCTHLPDYKVSESKRPESQTSHSYLMFLCRYEMVSHALSCIQAHGTQNVSHAVCSIQAHDTHCDTCCLQYTGTRHSDCVTCCMQYTGTQHSDCSIQARVTQIVAHAVSSMQRCRLWSCHLLLVCKNVALHLYQARYTVYRNVAFRLCHVYPYAEFKLCQVLFVVRRNTALMLYHVPFVICRDTPLRMCHVLCVVCRHVTLRVLPCAVACTDMALRFCHALLHAGIWHSGCVMCCVLYTGMPSWHAEGQPACL